MQLLPPHTHTTYSTLSRPEGRKSQKSEAQKKMQSKNADAMGDDAKPGMGNKIFGKRET